MKVSFKIAMAHQNRPRNETKQNREAKAATTTAEHIKHFNTMKRTKMPCRKRKNDDLNKCLLIECEFFLNGKPEK